MKKVLIINGHQYYDVVARGELTQKYIDKATKFFLDNGFEVKIIDDSKYGKVNNYHINAIEGFKKYLDNNPCALPKYRFA